jgi:hypothetical protein
MNRRLGITATVFVVIAIFIVLAIARPWNFINYIPYVSPTTALTVNSLRGKSEVYFDGKKVGETPYSSELLSSGDHELEVRRISDSPDFYQTMKKTIHLELGTRTFVEVEIGPSTQFSSLKLVYYRKSSIDKPSLYINTVPSGSKAFVDTEEYGETPVTTSSISKGRHTISVEQAGYESAETTVIAREGFTLIVELNLMAKPIDLQEE